MIPLTREQKKRHCEQKFVICAKKGFSTHDDKKKIP